MLIILCFFFAAIFAAVWLPGLELHRAFMKLYGSALELDGAFIKLHGTGLELYGVFTKLEGTTLELSKVFMKFYETGLELDKVFVDLYGTSFELDGAITNHEKESHPTAASFCIFITITIKDFCKHIYSTVFVKGIIKISLTLQKAIVQMPLHFLLQHQS